MNTDLFDPIIKLFHVIARYGMDLLDTSWFLPVIFLFIVPSLIACFLYLCEKDPNKDKNIKYPPSKYNQE